MCWGACLVQVLWYSCHSYFCNYQLYHCFYVCGLFVCILVSLAACAMGWSAICDYKNPSLVWGWDKNSVPGITVLHHEACQLMKMVIARDWFFYPTLTLMIDSYNPKWVKQRNFSWDSFFQKIMFLTFCPPPPPPQPWCQCSGNKITLLKRCGIALFTLEKHLTLKFLREPYFCNI